MNQTAATARRSRVTLQHGRAYCYGKLARASKPRDRLTVSQWADRHRWLSSKQSGETGRWRTARNPLLEEIQNVLSAHHPARKIVIMKSSQVGVTEAMINWLGYIIDHAPAPAMVLMPTLESRDAWKVQKLNPLFAETRQIRDIIGGLRSRDSANRQDMIDFPGGILFLAGGNSPNSYAQRSVRYLALDDLDRFPAEVGEEGDPVALAEGRLKAFERSKLLLVSTPTVKGASLIEREYEASDQRHAHVPCPHCGEYQRLTWGNMHWDPSVTRAWYECAHCGQGIEEHHKAQMLPQRRWIPERPEIKTAIGYQFSALYAPIGLGPSWIDLAHRWKKAQSDPALLKTFINTDLGEAWEDQTSALKPHELAKRMEDLKPRTIPIGCLAITVGVDTQDSWLAVHMLGWGADHLWVLEYHEIQGDTTRPEVWDELEAYLHAWPVNAFGKEIRFRACGIDSRGHRTEEVRQFVARSSLKIPAYAIQGSTRRMGRPIATQASQPDKTKRGRAVRGGAVRGGGGVWNVGTEHCKDFIIGRLASDSELAPQDGYIRFCRDLPDEYFDGLLSEFFNPQTNRYEQKKGARWKRNEPLDTIVYAWAIGHHREVNLGRRRNGKIDPNYWTRLEAVLEPDGTTVHVPVAAPAAAVPEASPAPAAPVVAQQQEPEQAPKRNPFAPITMNRD
jgi:phage terminase large subunit GpA-like protein